MAWHFSLIEINRKIKIFVNFAFPDFNSEFILVAQYRLDNMIIRILKNELNFRVLDSEDTEDLDFGCRSIT